MAKKQNGNGHPRTPTQLAPYPTETPEMLPDDKVERINSVRVQVLDKDVILRSKRACGHGQSVTVGMGADITISFGTTMVEQDGKVLLVEDCVECERINRARQAELDAAIAESLKKAEQPEPEA